VYALDVTRPDVISWLTDLAAAAVADGFSYLKLDFLYAAALAGVRHAAVSGHSAFRTALAALRAGAGDEAFLDACGAPLWPAIGLVDAMRVGPDVAPHWTPGRTGRVDYQTVSCLENTWRSARLRAQFHGALWANDPDCVMLRRHNTALTRSERMGWAHWVADSGQLLMVSDACADLDARDYETWSALLARRTLSTAAAT
jgi:alpha-galactosidase